MDFITFLAVEGFSLLLIYLAYRYNALLFDVINVVLQLFITSILFSNPVLNVVTNYTSTSSTYTPYTATLAISGYTLIFIPIILLIVSAIHIINRWS